MGKPERACTYYAYKLNSWTIHIITYTYCKMQGKVFKGGGGGGDNYFIVMYHETKRNNGLVWDHNIILIHCWYSGGGDETGPGMGICPLNEIMKMRL